MSSSSSCFLLFFLCLSLHACSARRLGGAVVDHSKVKLEKNKLHHHFPIKNDMKDVVKQAESGTSLSKEVGSIKEAKGHREKVENAKKKLSSSSSSLSSSSGAVRARTNKSSSVVSWRVPNRKRGEKHPGFNLDYSPPKTHPPSHN